MSIRFVFLFMAQSILVVSLAHATNICSKDPKDPHYIRMTAGSDNNVKFEVCTFGGEAKCRVLGDRFDYQIKELIGHSYKNHGAGTLILVKFLTSILRDNGGENQRFYINANGIQSACAVWSREDFNVIEYIKTGRLLTPVSIQTSANDIEEQLLAYSDGLKEIEQEKVDADKMAQKLATQEPQGTTRRTLPPRFQITLRME